MASTFMTQMFPLTWLLWVLLSASNFAKLAGAVPSDCGSGPTAFTITSQADADAISHCRSINGTVTILSDTLQNVTLNGVVEIWNNLIIEGCQSLQLFSAPDLLTINVNFTLFDLPLLQHIDLPALKNVTGWMDWQRLPSLHNASFPAGINDDEVFNSKEVTYINGVTISNTSVSSLDGLTFTTADTIDISNNPQLAFVNLSSLVSVTQSLSVSANAPGATIYLPSLETTADVVISGASVITAPRWTYSAGYVKLSGNSFASSLMPPFATFNHITTLEISDNSLLTTITLPVLKTGGNLVVTNNPSLTSISAPSLSLLTSLSIQDNSVLTEVYMPLLKTVYQNPFTNNCLTIVNNSNLVNLTEMRSLTTLQGVTTLNGNFAKVSFPLLATYVGSFFLNTTVRGFDCTLLDLLTNSNNYSPSNYRCLAIVPGTLADTAIHTPRFGAANDSGPMLSNGTRLGIVCGCGAVGLILIFFFLRYYRKKYARETPVLAARDEYALDHELPLYRANPLPGEAPPRYKETSSVHEIENQSPRESLGDFERRRPEPSNRSAGIHENGNGSGAISRAPERNLGRVAIEGPGEGSARDNAGGDVRRNDEQDHEVTTTRPNT